MTHTTLSMQKVVGGVTVDGPQDLHLDEDGNLAFAFGADAVGQHARQRTKFHQGEWFLDTEAGVPWLNDVLGKQPDTTLAEALLKAELLDTDGVTAIDALSVRFDRQLRSIQFDRVDVSTIYDGE